MSIIDFVNVYGLPITVAGGMGYFIFFIWKFVTVKIKPKLGATFTVLVALIDRIRSLDNEIIRQDTMIKTILGVPNLIDIDKIAKADRDDQRKD